LKTTFISVFVCIVAMGGFVWYSISGNEEGVTSYVAEIEKERQEQQVFMKSDPNSPFVLEKKEFTSLKYFPVDSRYRIKADLEPIENKEVITLTTSDGLQQQYLQHAYALFEIDKQPCKLLILEVMQMGPQRGTLFLAFADATSAAETYGAGRYLSVKKVKGASTMEIDFNKAYNPYCAYVDNFSCPFPPRENMLKVAIRAGEKNY
jgi:uncharacterized protein (DUF1684 family)